MIGNVKRIQTALLKDRLKPSQKAVKELKSNVSFPTKEGIILNIKATRTVLVEMKKK